MTFPKKLLGFSDFSKLARPEGLISEPKLNSKHNKARAFGLQTNKSANCALAVFHRHFRHPQMDIF